MTEEKKKSPDKSESLKEEPPSMLEWTFAAVGLMVVAAALGFLIYRGATKADTPPQIKVEVESVTQTGENYLVNFRISNTGDTTAAGLTVEGELKNGEKSEESSDISLAYLPAQSARRGGLFFTKNPREFQLKIRAKGFEQP